MLARVSGLCALGLALGAVALQAQDVFVLPGAGASGGEVVAFAASPLSQIEEFPSGNGSFVVLPNLTATKYFVVASSSTQTVTSADSTFFNPLLVATLSSPATAAVTTPDGRLLAVAAASLHIFDIATSSEAVTGGLSQGTGVSTFDVASSLDSSTLFALGSTSAGNSQLTAFSTSTYSVSATLSIPQPATALAVGRNGLVYVSLPNEILEIDPRTLEPTVGGTMNVSGTPGRLVFTPDGQFAVAANQSSLIGSALLVVNLATHLTSAPNLGLPPITSLQILGTDSIIALAEQGLYQVTLSTPIAVQALQVSGLPSKIEAITVSNEVPAGAMATVQSVYAVGGNDIFQINPVNLTILHQYPLPSGIGVGALSFAAPTLTPLQTRPSLLLTYGTNQAIAPSATSQPLVVQVLDANNHPVMGVAVEFQSNSSGAALLSANVTTGANGYALIYVTAPAATGPIVVTATVGSLSGTFNINVSSSAGGGSTPQLSIVAGQGQLLTAETNTDLGPAAGSPLIVRLTDSNGNPLAGVPVTFSVPASGGNIVVVGAGLGPVETVKTAADGTAQVDFLTFSLPTNNSTGFVQTIVTATSTGTNPVSFYVTTVSQNPGATVQIISPTPGQTLTGPEGSTLPAAVSVQVFSGGFAIPNVSLILANGNLDPSIYPTVSCTAPNGGPVLTNTKGFASCDVVFGPRVGSGSFAASIGYTHSSDLIRFTVTPGAAAVAQIVQGNNQTGRPGQTLPIGLLTHVTDSGGNAVKGAAVTWQVLPAGAVSLSQVSSITDTNGDAYAVATLGTIGGVAQVQVTVGSASATFNLTVNIPSAGLQKVSGDQQTTAINTAFASPITVKVVDPNGNGVPGAQVNFQVTSGVATLGSSSAITDSTGQASITVTAGATAGAITITATSSTFSVSFTLTAQLPGPSNITIVNGASFSTNTGISPGGIATIRGTGILPGVQGLVSAANSAGQLPTTFSGVTITFDGTAAPIYYVQDINGADQVSVQVPFEVQPGSAVALTINVANSGSATVMVPVKPLAPGVFISNYGGKNYAVAVRPDGSPVSPTNPAQRGENIQLYVTGLGQATPSIATGAAGVPDQPVVSRIVVGLNNGGVPLISAVYGPGLIGVYVITLHVPANTQTGPHQPVGIIAVDSAGAQHYAQNTYIPIQ